MKASILFCISLLLAACEADTSSTPAGTATQAEAEAPAASGGAEAGRAGNGGAKSYAGIEADPDPRLVEGSADAHREVILDLRDQSPQQLPEETRARELVEQVFGDGAPANATVVGYASGEFTGPGLDQQVVVIARPMVTARPAPPQGMISVLQDGRAIADFVPDTGYHALAGTADINEDGSDELLLRVDSMQMGIVSSTIHVVSLSGGSLRVIERFENAAQDSCDNPVGDRERLAAVLSRDGDGGIARKDYRADCGDGEYQPVR